MHAARLLRRALTLSGVVGITAFVTATVVSQPENPGSGTQSEPENLMQAWMEAAAPGPEHQRLMKRAGTWKQKITQWPSPGADPLESIAHAEDEVAFGGRFLIEHVHGDMLAAGGQAVPFDGMGIYGYDNIKQKYVFAWIDNMGTMITTGEGEPDQHANVVTYYGHMPSPIDNTPIRFRMVVRVFNDNEYGIQWYQKLGDGTWHKGMDLIASRE